MRKYSSAGRRQGRSAAAAQHRAGDARPPLTRLDERHRTSGRRRLRHGGAPSGSERASERSGPCRPRRGLTGPAYPQLFRRAPPPPCRARRSPTRPPQEVARDGGAGSEVVPPRGADGVARRGYGAFAGRRASPRRPARLGREAQGTASQSGLRPRSGGLGRAWPDSCAR